MGIQKLLAGFALAAAMNVAYATNLFVGVNPVTGDPTFFIGSGVGNVTGGDAPASGVVLPAQQMRIFMGTETPPGGAVTSVDLDTFIQNAGPAVIEAIIRNKAAIDQENAAFIERQQAALGAGGQTQTPNTGNSEALERMRNNLDNLVGNIIKKAIDQGTVDRDQIQSVIDQVNQQLSKKIDLDNVKPFERSEQEQARLAQLEAERQKKREAEKDKQAQLKKQDEELQKRLKEQQAKQQAEKERAAEAAKQKAAEEHAKKLADDKARAALEEKQKALAEQKQKQAPQLAEERAQPRNQASGPTGTGGTGDESQSGAHGAQGDGGDGGTGGEAGQGGDGGQGGLLIGHGGASGDGGQGGLLAGRGGDGGTGGQAGQGGAGGDGGQVGLLTGQGSAGGDGGQGGAGGDGGAGGQAGQGAASGSQGDGAPGPQADGPTGGGGAGGAPGGLDPRQLALVGSNRLNQSQQQLGENLNRLREGQSLPVGASDGPRPGAPGTQDDEENEPNVQATPGGNPSSSAPGTQAGGTASGDPASNNRYDPNAPVNIGTLRQLVNGSGLPPIPPATLASLLRDRMAQLNEGNAPSDGTRDADEAAEDKLLRDFVEQIAALEEFPYIAAGDISGLPPTRSLTGDFSATYNGRVSGAFGDGTKVGGAMSLNVGFDDFAFTGDIVFDGGNGKAGVEGGWTGGVNSVTGRIYSPEPVFGGEVGGSLSGKFYGPQGQELGGKWSMEIYSGLREGQSANGQFATKQ